MRKLSTDSAFNVDLSVPRVNNRMVAHIYMGIPDGSVSSLCGIDGVSEVSLVPAFKDCTISLVTKCRKCERHIDFSSLRIVRRSN